MPSNEKYTLLSKLDSGGMAEVFLGEAEGIEGFKKRVAIKRILPHMGENKKFIRMFLDEARLTMKLNHGNIVQMFDIGRSAGGSYFIVMEYVNGTNLKKVVEYLRNLGQKIPVELAVFIGIEICRGLSYAHHLVDRAGRPLEIVHRDVSPPNVLLSRQGEVKLVDFGLAKAASQIERTEPGVVKGKYAYLSPEAAWGQEVDCRADIFSCGIVLWELIAGRRLFYSENNVDSIKAIRNPQVPSLQEIRPEVGPELESILCKALAKNPAERFQDCEEMAEALAHQLFVLGRGVTSFDLKRFVEATVQYEERTSPGRISAIDEVVQEDLSGFASLEETTGDLDLPPLPPDAPGTGAKPLDPSIFDTSDEISVVGVSEPPRLRPMPPSIDDSRASEASLARLLEGNSQLINLSDNDTSSKSRTGAIILGIVATLVLGAAAYFVARGL